MRVMPRLSSFYGIVIYMYRPDHPPPHFHAQYGEYVAQIDLSSLEVMNGSLPARAFASFANGQSFIATSSRSIGISPRRWNRWSRSTRSRNIDAVLRVTAAKPLDGYKLEIEFNAEVVRVVDCSFLLHGTLGEPLKDLDYFRQVRVDHEARTVVWPNGLDPAPELLHGGQEAVEALERHRTAA
jgi:hypothetical protein